MNEQLEQEGIARVYRQWSNGGALPRYAALRPEVLQQTVAGTLPFRLHGEKRPLKWRNVGDPECMSRANHAQLVE